MSSYTTASLDDVRYFCDVLFLRILLSHVIIECVIFHTVIVACHHGAPPWEPIFNQDLQAKKKLDGQCCEKEIFLSLQRKEQFAR